MTKTAREATPYQSVQESIIRLRFADPWLFKLGGWTGVAALAAIGLIVVLNGHWISVLQLAFFLMASIYLLAFDRELPSWCHFLFIVAALMNAIGWVWNEFEGLPAYDEIAHFYTSFSITMAVAVLVYRRAQQYFCRHPSDFVLVVVSFGITLGALWEVFEWIILLGEFQDSPISDLIYDGIGSIVAAALAVWAGPKLLCSERRRAFDAEESSP